MDDKEYYSLMNRSNSALIIQELLKKSQQKKEQQNKTFQNSQNINRTEGRQGREDTEMLHEKDGDFE